MFSTAREQEKSCICLLVHFAFQLISLFLSKRIYQKYCIKNKKIVHHFHSFCVHGLLQILHSNLNESAFTTNSPVTPIKNKESLLINSCIRIKWIVIDTFTIILMCKLLKKKMKNWKCCTCNAIQSLQNLTNLHILMYVQVHVQ